MSLNFTIFKKNTNDKDLVDDRDLVGDRDLVDDRDLVGDKDLVDDKRDLNLINIYKTCIYCKKYHASNIKCSEIIIKNLCHNSNIPVEICTCCKYCHYCKNNESNHCLCVKCLKQMCIGHCNRCNNCLINCKCSDKNDVDAFINIFDNFNIDSKY